MLMGKDPGYVLVAYGERTIETSLWAGIFSLFLVYLLVRIVMFIWRRVIGGRLGVSQWRARRQVRGARTKTVQGLLLMAEGEWQAANRVLIEGAKNSETPLINYLNAARAAHELDNTEQRDDLLRQAHETTPGSQFAVNLTQAHLQIDKHQWEQALATLLSLRNKAPKHHQVLDLLKTCYLQIEDWQALGALLPDLKKQKRLDAAELLELEGKVWVNQLSNMDNPTKAWKKLPRELQGQAEVLRQTVAFIDASGQTDAAAQIVAQQLANTWDDELLDQYGRMLVTDIGTQMVNAEKWLKERPNNPVLLLALGRIALKQKQWSKAREYFEASLRLKRRGDAAAELGRLCIALGETDRGSGYLAQSLEGLPDLPMPVEAG
jgi:HemY protein